MKLKVYGKQRNQKSQYRPSKRDLHFSTSKVFVLKKRPDSPFCFEEAHGAAQEARLLGGTGRTVGRRLRPEGLCRVRRNEYPRPGHREPKGSLLIQVVVSCGNGPGLWGLMLARLERVWYDGSAVDPLCACP